MALTKITSRILDSSGVTTVGTISTGVWQGTAINQTYLVGQSGTNTGDETLARINALDITELGTISSGVWNGTAIDQTYLVGQSGTNTGDQTTISGNAGTVTNGVYTVGNQTIAGVKTFSSAVNLTSADDTRLKLTDTGNSSELIFRSDGANTQIYTNTAHDLGIYTANNVGQIHLKQSTGDVGIGTSDPSSLLSLGNAVDAQKLLLYDDSNFYKYGFGIQSNELRQFFPNSSTAKMTFGTISDSDGTTYSPKLTILSGGDVGIGTTSPSNTAWGTSTQLTIEETSSSSSSYAVLNLFDSGGVATKYSMGVGNTYFYMAYDNIANAHRMVINNDGHVGIGTTSPSSRLDITATRTAQLTLIELSTNTLSSAVDDEISIDFGRGLLDKYSARISGYISNYSTYDGGLKFYTSSGGTLNTTPQLTISSGGLATFSNGIQFAASTGTPSPPYDSGATTLDAYEEGNWTPVVRFGTSSATTISSYVAAYTRIGNVVYIQVSLNYVGNTGSGDLFIEGLPYAVGSAASFGDVQGTARWTGISTGSGNQMSPYFYAGQSKIAPQIMGGAGYLGAVSSSMASNGWYLYGCEGFYMI